MFYNICNTNCYLCLHKVLTNQIKIEMRKKNCKLTAKFVSLVLVYDFFSYCIFFKYIFLLIKNQKVIFSLVKLEIEKLLFLLLRLIVIGKCK